MEQKQIANEEKKTAEQRTEETKREQASAPKEKAPNHTYTRARITKSNSVHGHSIFSLNHTAVHYTHSLLNPKVIAKKKTSFTSQNS